MYNSNIKRLLHTMNDILEIQDVKMNLLPSLHMPDTKIMLLYFITKKLINTDTFFNSNPFN